MYNKMGYIRGKWVGKGRGFATCRGKRSDPSCSKGHKGRFSYRNRSRGYNSYGNRGRSNYNGYNTQYKDRKFNRGYSGRSYGRRW